MDEAENTDTGINTEFGHNYHDTSSSVHDSIIYSNNKQQLKKSLRSNLQYPVFQHFRRKGLSETSDTSNISDINKFSSRFIYQYYSFRRDRNFKRRYMSKNADVNFRKRKLLSTFKKNRNIKQPSKYNERKKRKRRNKTDSKQIDTVTQNKHISEVVTMNDSMHVTNSSKVNLKKLALQELKEYEEFVTLMQQTFSKDPLRAMLSITFLMIVMLLTMKLCGMKPTKKHQEIHSDFQEEVHYVNIHDILKRKRRYLPKYLLSWERRLRRNYKRRQRIKKASEHEQALAPVSDNSEEETLIYGGNYDF